MDSRENLTCLLTDMFDKCINTIAKNVSDPIEQNEFIKILETSVYELANMDVKHKHLENIIEESKEECLQKNLTNIEEVFKKNSTIIDDISDNENHCFVKKFREKVNSLNVFENFVPTEKTTNLPLDPITQVPIVNPVRNRQCGHLYEKSSIQRVLKKKKKMRCPYVGCRHQDYFVYENLEENVALSQQNTQNLEISEHQDETL